MLRLCLPANQRAQVRRKSTSGFRGVRGTGPRCHRSRGGAMLLAAAVRIVDNYATSSVGRKHYFSQGGDPSCGAACWSSLWRRAWRSYRRPRNRRKNKTDETGPKILATRSSWSSKQLAARTGFIRSADGPCWCWACCRTRRDGRDRQERGDGVLRQGAVLKKETIDWNKQTWSSSSRRGQAEEHRRL